MRYNLAFEGFGPVLAGAANGRAAFAALVKYAYQEPKQPTPLFVDFQDVQVATASFLRESLFALKAHLRHADSKYYPVAANPNEVVYDELLTIANARGDAILGCELQGEDLASDVHLIGQLDPKQQMTFDLVQRLKTTDASRLMEQFGEAERTTSTTAWNNRLASLVAKGIISEFTNGRAKYYRPLLEVEQ